MLVAGRFEKALFQICVTLLASAALINEILGGSNSDRKMPLICHHVEEQEHSQLFSIVETESFRGHVPLNSYHLLDEAQQTLARSARWC